MHFRFMVTLITPGLRHGGCGISMPTASTILRLIWLFLSIPYPLSGWATEGIWIDLDAQDLVGAESIWIVVDDDATGVGIIDECLENDNGFLLEGPFCE